MPVPGRAMPGTIHGGGRTVVSLLVTGWSPCAGARSRSAWNNTWGGGRTLLSLLVTGWSPCAGARSKNAWNNEHGNDSVIYRAVERDILTVVLFLLRQLIFY